MKNKTLVKIRNTENEVEDYLYLSDDQVKLLECLAGHYYLDEYTEVELDAKIPTPIDLCGEED